MENKSLMPNPALQKLYLGFYHFVPHKERMFHKKTTLHSCNMSFQLLAYLGQTLKKVDFSLQLILHIIPILFSTNSQSWIKFIYFLVLDYFWLPVWFSRDSRMEMQLCTLNIHTSSRNLMQIYLFIFFSDFTSTKILENSVKNFLNPFGNIISEQIFA